MATMKARLRQVINGFGYVARGDFAGLVSRVRWYAREHTTEKLSEKFVNPDGVVWGILCTPHTIMIAQAISNRLAHHGINSEIIQGALKTFHHDFYVVLCAQTFKKLPPPEKRAVFQLEQSVHSRWFTDDYFKVLRESFSVIDYSLTNIEFLATHGIEYPNVHYVPIGASVGRRAPNQNHKKYDFIFYGDSKSSPRRQKLLSALQSKYNVKVCNDHFGDDLHAEIACAKAVVNLHYYEGALLEMPRIAESLSIGVPVLSESTTDQDDYQELGNAVWFFDEGSIPALMKRAGELLEHLDGVNAALADSINASSQRFNFMLDRFLAAIGSITLDRVLREPFHVAKGSNYFALSLPETIKRRRALNLRLPGNCVIFDGIRHKKGWIGCGSSFKALATYALNNDIRTLIVIEDDAVLPPDFDSTLEEITRYLSRRDSTWDIFSGLMAEVNLPVNVYAAEQYKERTYITIDRITSTVFNIYNKTALEHLAQWDPLDSDAEHNTIDRYLDQRRLRVVVSIPFIVGHDEEVISTLWGFVNKRYSSMIEKSQQKLERLYNGWKKEHP